MPIRICVAGATGWTGSEVTKQILAAEDLRLVGALARRSAGEDIGKVLGLPSAGVRVAGTLEEALSAPTDVLIDFTAPASVKERTHAALDRGVRVVIGASGLSADEYEEIARHAQQRGLGVIAAGNFSITAALAKHFALLAAQYLPSWEIIDYAHAGKVDAPSGTVRELAEALGQAAHNQMERAVEQTHGAKEARGASIGGAQVHSICLPGYVISFETIFGLPDERLVIRHDSDTGAAPYVAGTLLAARRVLEVTGLVRGLDTLLFHA